MTGEMHTDTLFEKYTINEIREIEKKTKSVDFEHCFS